MQLFLNLTNVFIHSYSYVERRTDADYDAEEEDQIEEEAATEDAILSEVIGFRRKKTILVFPIAFAKN